MRCIKRNGIVVNFDEIKIFKAIQKAGNATAEFETDEAERLLKIVLTRISKKTLEEKRDYVTVEEIQDFVEETLMSSGFYKTARAYIIYREQHRKIREIKPLLDPKEVITKYVSKEDWRVYENSNTTFSLQGLNMHLATSSVSRFWLNEIYPEEVRKAHIDGDFYIHDLGYLSTYCVGWDLKDLLISGLGGVSGKVESKPPKHFRSALGQAVNFIFTMQGEAAGAQAFSSFDTYLAPFIRYDNLKYKDIKQAIQEFVFNINVPTRSGFQSPFSNITLDLKPQGILAKEGVIIGGEVMSETYEEFQEEMDLLNKAFAEVMLEGDGKGRVFSFPIPTYNISKDFDWENEELNPIFEMAGKFGIPYFSNFINSDMKPDDARSMCCRLRIDNRELRKRGGGLFGANPLTGSVGVVTINLPRIGYLSKTEKEFFERLSKLMDIAKTSLLIKRKVIEHFTEVGLYPYSRFYLRNIKKEEGSYWAHHFNTIGINGMNEALLNFMGSDIGTVEGKEFAIKTLNFMREKLREYQEETGMLFNLEATPAESATYVLAKQDIAKFNNIIAAGEKDAPYYTNSTHLPVGYTDDPFKALDLQDELQILFTGGTVLHLFLGERISDIKTVKELVKTVAENYKLPYFTITPTFSICPKHGYIKGEHKYCPICDEEIALNFEKENAYNEAEDSGNKKGVVLNLNSKQDFSF